MEKHKTKKRQGKEGQLDPFYSPKIPPPLWIILLHNNVPEVFGNPTAWASYLVGQFGGSNGEQWKGLSNRSMVTHSNFSF